MVRPYFFTPSPKVALCTTELGHQYAVGGVALSSLVTSEMAIAASIVLLGQLLAQNAIGANADSVPRTVLPLEEHPVS